MTDETAVSPYLELAGEEAEALDQFKRFLEREFRPYVEKLGDREPTADECRYVLRMLAPFGVGRMYTPVEHGGEGFSNILTGRMIEEICRIDGGLGGMVSLQDGSVGDFARLAPAHMREKDLEGMLAGEILVCTAITEPDVGSNPRDVKTRALRRNDRLHVQGSKTWISNAQVADVAIVVAKTTQDSDGPLTRVILDRSEGQFTSSGLTKLGLHSWPTGSLFIDSDVPVANVMEEGKGLIQTLRSFERARCYVGVISLGIATAALEEAIAYARERIQWGKPIAGHQTIQIKIAEMAAMLDAAKLLVYRGLRLVDRGDRCDTQTSIAKLFATEAGVQIADNAVRICGANGISADYRVSRLFRDARIMPVPDGTSDIQRLLIGRNLTGHSAFA